MFELTTELLDRLLVRETAEVDWKAGGDPEKIVRTISAFANDYEKVGGGYIILGVKEEVGGPEVVGLLPEQAKSKKKQILHWCREFIQPPLYPEVAELSVGTSVVVAFRQKRSPDIVGLSGKKKIHCVLGTSQ